MLNVQKIYKKSNYFAENSSTKFDFFINDRFYYLFSIF
ncbi:hypothetical protein RV14_GL001267 [Enterococcus ratti]|uniref:Uncharacterized protein n=1 Tax=Enterococcus ratti TaxID=150033 RepID=A0A1L8WAF6_9ENTE|nr:hypothetical protein RV14_GL001267 [Enterococcus ratti]